MTPRRRKKRHALNPMRYVPPETWAQIGKGVAGALVVVAPAAAVKRDSDVKQDVQNQALNVALANAAALQESLTVFRQQFAEFRREIRESRLRERQTAARLPQNMVGPAVPADWQLKPPKRHWWQFGRG